MMMGSSGNKKMPMMPEMEEDADMYNEEDEKSSHLLAFQNILDGISDLVGEDLKPYIDEAKQAMHLAHETAEGDEMGVENAEDEMGMPKKEGMDITIGMGKPPSLEMDSDMEEEDDDEMAPKKGFLAVLAKKVKNK